MIELILGGARSGKSRFAEQRVQQHVKQSSVTQAPAYIATATAGDTEMHARIAAHQLQRNEQQKNTLPWQTVEIPIRLAEGLREFNSAQQIVLVDCLTLWLSNCLHRGELCWKRERAEFLDALKDFSGTVILVSNEVGQGVVPLGELSRHFVDEAGRLHQDIAATADRVIFCIAGLPQILKGSLL